MARPLSRPLTVGALAATGAGRGVVVGAAGRDATGAALARGAGAADVGAPAGDAAGAADAPVGPPGGNVGNLIVGAADGFGGRLMRTVSFLGWTLPVSFFGGTAPAGMLGMFSAIKSLFAKIESRSIVSNSYSSKCQRKQPDRLESVLDTCRKFLFPLPGFLRMNSELLAKAKSLGFSDRQIAHLTGTTEDAVRAERKKT